ncbi:MAG: FAD-dependent oxidoreductase [Planctomycetaceae bacterium]
MFDPSYDAIVVGGGPVGCVAARLLAKRGARTLLVEACPQATGKLAGEWLHPSALRVLQSAGLDPDGFADEAIPGRGFVLHPADDGPEIVLPYRSGQAGCSIEHEHLVGRLREAAQSHELITFASGWRVVEVAEGEVRLARAHGTQSSLVRTPLVVGADGRASVVRRSMRPGGDDPRRRSHPISYMVGTVVRGVELPYESFANVLLADDGPVFMYRIGPDSLRVTMDVPRSTMSRARRDPTRLVRGLERHLSTHFLRALTRAMRGAELRWAGTSFRARVDYGNDGRALAGDAVGHFHPLTATGLTMGFLDAAALASGIGLAAYRAQRERETYLPELASLMLYELFTREDSSAERLREAAFSKLRGDVAMRDSLIRMLSGDFDGWGGFARMMTDISLRAARRALSGSADSTKRWSSAGDVGRLLPWLTWPLIAAAPRVGRPRLRRRLAAFLLGKYSGGTNGARAPRPHIDEPGAFEAAVSAPRACAIAAAAGNREEPC